MLLKRISSHGEGRGLAARCLCCRLRSLQRRLQRHLHKQDPPSAADVQQYGVRQARMYMTDCSVS